MAWDDPVVWVLIIGLGILVFGSNKIPELARSLGRARREFDQASKGLADTINSEINNVQNPIRMKGSTDQVMQPSPQPAANDIIPESDPLLIAARNEGIDTRGKSRSQIASELASKVKD
jgi:sec-independent protein translocase protein TatA